MCFLKLKSNEKELCQKHTILKKSIVKTCKYNVMHFLAKINQTAEKTDREHHRTFIIWLFNNRCARVELI